MRLPLNWVFKEPIDIEYKHYILMDYLTKIDKDLNDFLLYPSFQELSLHLSNLLLIKNELKYIRLNKTVKSIDDEIFVHDVDNLDITGFTDEDIKTIVQISENSYDTLKDYFLVAKSMWSLIFESIYIKKNKNSSQLTSDNYQIGYFSFVYKEEKYLYKYKIGDEKNCIVSLIEKDTNTINMQKFLNSEYVLFDIIFDEEYPLDNSLLSLIKRKILNYVNQTIVFEEDSYNENEKK